MQYAVGDGGPRLARDYLPNGGRDDVFHRRRRRNLNCALGLSNSLLPNLLIRETFMLRISATFLSRFLKLFRPSPIAAPPTSDFQPVEAGDVDVGQVRELIGRVSVLTSAVAQDVGQHNVSVQ